MPVQSSSTVWQSFGDHYVAVNEAGDLRSKAPMRPNGVTYRDAIERPIDAALVNPSKHIVFFIHGGLNDLDTTVASLQANRGRYQGQPWHWIYLAWDSGWKSSIDDVTLSFRSIRSWRNLKRLGQYALPWNWIGGRMRFLNGISYFGGIGWKSQYDTAFAATGMGSRNHGARRHGFLQALSYLESRLADHPDVKISFVVHSAGAIVANYLIDQFEHHMPELGKRVSNYVLLAPACHLTQFETSVQRLNSFAPESRLLVVTLTEEQELADTIYVYNRSLLWGVHDLFESGWKRKEFTRYRIPIRPRTSHEAPENRALLGIKQLINELGGSSGTSDGYDRTQNGRVHWITSGEAANVPGVLPPLTVTAEKHGGFFGDVGTVEMIRAVLS